MKTLLFAALLFAGFDGGQILKKADPICPKGVCPSAKAEITTPLLLKTEPPIEIPPHRGPRIRVETNEPPVLPDIKIKSGDGNEVILRPEQSGNDLIISDAPEAPSATPDPKNLRYKVQRNKVECPHCHGTFNQQLIMPIMP